MNDLEGKVAVITGANAGLARPVVGALYENGASVVMASRSIDALNDQAAAMGFDAGRVLCLRADVTEPGDVTRMVDEAVGKFGQIDALITFSGQQVRKPALELDIDEWRRVVDVNLTGSFLCAQSVARQMAAQKSGKIVFISSLTAEIGLPNMAAYGASKGAIRQLTKALAVEWAPLGISVNCIGPGRFRTPMTEDVFSDPDLERGFLSCIPQGRAGVPEDLVGIALFLCSSQSDYFTGQSFYPDGGWLAGGGAAEG